MTSSLYKGRQEWFSGAWPEGLVPEKNEVAARALIVHDGRVLLAYEAASDEWLTPGGRLTPGEPLLEAFEREVEEETALQVTRGDLVAFFDVLVPHRRSHKFEFIFLAHPTVAPDWIERDHTDGDQTTSSVVTKLRWFTPEEAAALPNVFPNFIRNWPALLEARPQAYYGTKIEDGFNTIHNIERFYISSRVVATHDDKVLMVYNSKGNFWFGPGGQIEFGEHLPECAVREVHEETGLTATAGDVVAVDEFFSPSYKIHQINLYTRCELAHGNLPAGWQDTAASGHVAACAFHTRQELDGLPRAYPSYMAELAWPDAAPLNKAVA